MAYAPVTIKHFVVFIFSAYLIIEKTSYFKGIKFRGNLIRGNFPGNLGNLISRVCR